MSDSAMNRLLQGRKPVTERVDNLLPVADAASPEIEQEPYSKMFLRIETNIDERLRTICLKQKLSRETFIEAACAYLFANPEALKVVVAEGKARTKHRKQLGTKRRAQAMLSSNKD
jgi:hypothetical protein